MPRYFGIRREMDPSPAQARGLARAVGAARFAQNWSLHHVKTCLDSGIPQSWTAISLHTAWREHRAEVAPWYAECSKETFQYGCDRTAAGLASWNAAKKGMRHSGRGGFPRMRKRGKNDSARFTGGRVRADGMDVMIPRVGDIHLKEALLVPDGCRVTELVVRERAGRWFVVARCRQDGWVEPPKREGSVMGVDFGVGDRFATLSDGTVVDNPRYFRKDAARLARAQRAMDRKKAGSENRRKARLRYSKLSYKVASRRQDFLHKFTTDLVKTHAQIVIEDLNIAGMAANRKFHLGKSVHDVALSKARRQLEYKASWYGATVTVADRWFASSRKCSKCGVNNTALTLADRKWTCACGVVHDRDVNAAVNLAASSAVAACGAGVSPGANRAVCIETGRNTGVS